MKREKLNNQMYQNKLNIHFAASRGRCIFLSLFMMMGFFSTPLSGQIMVRGIVIEKEGKRHVPDASVKVKGTVTGTKTAVDGSFSIQVNKEGDILIVQSPAHYTRAVAVKGKELLLITLKNYCNIDYFDNQRISFGIQSGVKNTPLGGYFGASLPYMGTAGTAWTRAEYQSGQEAYFLRLEAGYDHMVSECDFRFDLKAGYTKVSNGNSLGAIIYTAGGTAHFYRVVSGVRYFNFYAGAGLMYFNERDPSRWRKYAGPSIGFGTEVFRRNKVRLNGQVLMIRHHPEIQFLAD